jgi:predicted ATP-grasp superfamily ATP-dependent carboligase
VRALLDKAAFQILAEESGLPVPRAVVLRGRGELPRLDALGLPAVIKPASKMLVLNGLAARAERVESRERAREVAEGMIRQTGCVIAQEWIEGPDSNIYFTLFACGPQGEIAGVFSGRKLLCAPPAVGSTALCVPAGEIAAELEELTRRFIQLVRYRGLGSLEFKRDARSGKLLIVEPTVGRTDWQEESATLCGVNLPLTAYRLALGKKPRPAKVSSPAPVAWRSSYRIHPEAGSVPPGTRIGGGYFRLSDPLPGLFHYGYEDLGLRAWNRITRALEKK